MTQQFSNHVLGQKRSLGEGAEKYLATQKFSNHVLGQKSLPGGEDRKIFGATENFKSCPWTRPAARFGLNP